MSSRRMSLLPRATLHSDSEQLKFLHFNKKIYLMSRTSSDNSNETKKLLNPPQGLQFGVLLLRLGLNIRIGRLSDKLKRYFIDPTQIFRSFFQLHMTIKEKIYLGSF